jgi:hypothetical protein
LPLEKQLINYNTIFDFLSCYTFYEMSHNYFTK